MRALGLGVDEERDEFEFDDDDELDEAAAGIVSGIFNYCDRWCERCAMTHRCRLALDEATVDAMTADGSDKAAAWEALLRGYEESARDEVEEAGDAAWGSWQGPEVVGSELGAEDLAEEEARRERRAAGHPCAVMGREYGMRCHAFLDAEATAEAFSSRGWNLEQLQGRVMPPGMGEPAERVWDALQVLGWYGFQIGVKLQRAADGLMDDRELEAELAELPDYVPDMEGSAKVALIGIDRSLAAWAVLRELVPGLGKEVFEILLELDKLRRATEAAFPGARALQRPGFEKEV